MMAGSAKERLFLVNSPYASDTDLCKAAAMGDAAARRRLVERLLDRVRRSLSYLVGDRPEAEDLSQVVLVEVLRSAGSFRGESTLEHWADRIAVHVAMRHFQKKYRRERLGAEFFEPAPPAIEMEERLASSQIRRKMAAILKQLPPERRTAVVLHHVLDYNVAEIAVITGAPLNTVRDRLRKGKMQLRSKILRDPEFRDLIEVMDHDHEAS